MDQFISSLFMKKQFVANDGLLFRFSDEEMKEWEADLHRKRITADEYETLLMLPYWELGFIPYILAGLRIFRISIGDLVNGDEPDLPPSANLVLPIFGQAWEAIRRGDLLIEKSNLSLSIPLVDAILHAAHAVNKEIIEDFCNNTNRHSIHITPVRSVVWAILNDIQLKQELLDLLCVYQERPKEELLEKKVRNRLVRFKKIHKIKKVTVPQENEIGYLAAAQILWLQEPGASKSKIAEHLLLKQFGPEYGYSKTSKHPLKLLGLIDPVGSYRPRGRVKNSMVVTNVNEIPRPIPGLFIEENGITKINLKIANIAFQAYIRVLQQLNLDITPIEVFTNPVIGQLIQGFHPLLKPILEDWQRESLEDPNSLFKSFPYLKNRHY